IPQFFDGSMNIRRKANEKVCKSFPRSALTLPNWGSLLFRHRRLESEGGLGADSGLKAPDSPDSPDSLDSRLIGVGQLPKHMWFPWESRANRKKQVRSVQERPFSSTPVLVHFTGCIDMSSRFERCVRFLLPSALVIACLLAGSVPGKQSTNGGQSTKSEQSTRPSGDAAQSAKTAPAKTGPARTYAVAEGGATSKSVLALPFKRSWEYLTDWMILVPPTVDGDRVYQPLQEGRVICLDRRSGSLLWSTESGGRVTAPVAISRSESGRVLYVASEK